MRLFSEKVNFTSTNSSLNILQVENFEEIFFGVYEIEINKNKYPVEKISEQNGNPVVSVPVVVEGVKSYYPFVLSKGKFEVLFNKKNTDDNLNSEHLSLDEVIIEEKITYPQDIVEEYVVAIPEYKNTQILEQIEKAKQQARRELKRIQEKNSKTLHEESSKKDKALKKTLNDARCNLVNEFVSISNKIKSDLISENDNRFGEINETIDNKISDLSNTLWDSLQEDFTKSSEVFDKTIRELVKESHTALQPKIDEELKSIATDIVEKVDSIEKNLEEKLSNKADKVLIENVEGELNSIALVNIELNDKINRGVNKALSRVGNISTKVDELTIALSEEVDNKIIKSEKTIENYYSEKLKMLEGKTFDLTENVRTSLMELISESKNNLILEIRKIQNEKPIEYVIESKGKREVKDFDSFEKDYDKKIKDRVDSEVTRLRKYISVYSGGGSVAMQFADGGTMNGNLTIVGAISASQYLGLPAGNGGGDDVAVSTKVRASSANWDSTYTTVQSQSGDWDYQGLDLKALSGNWDSTYTTVQSQSGYWGSNGGAYLPLSGGTMYGALSVYNSTIYTPHVQFNTSYIPTGSEPTGGMYWNSTDGTVNLVHDGATQQMGQELFIRVRNTTGSAILNGIPVYFNGRAGNRPLIHKAQSNNHATSVVVGVTTEDISDNSDGFITTFGYVRQIKTNYSGSGNWGTTWSEGDTLYVSKTIAGQLTNIEPTAPHDSDVIGHVGVLGGPGVGSIFISIEHHKTLEELSDVNGTALTTSGQIPVWDNDAGYFDFTARVTDPVKTTLAGNGVTTVFNISGADNLTNPNALIVSIDGAIQEPTVDYTISNDVITFTSPVLGGAKAVVIAPYGGPLTNEVHLSKPYKEISDRYTITNSDYTINCLLSSYTVTLPSANGILGRIYNIKNTGTGVITLSGNYSETIDGGNTALLTMQYQSITIQSTNSNWIII